jgi:hypothetical protein
MSSKLLVAVVHSRCPGAQTSRDGIESTTLVAFKIIFTLRVVAAVAFAHTERERFLRLTVLAHDDKRRFLEFM